MRLRVRYEGKAHTIKEISDTTTLAELKAQIAAATNLPERLQRLMNGFPLAPVSAADTSTLAEANIKNGDALQLEKKVGAAAAVATSAAAAASTNASLPPWCYKGAAVTYNRTGAAATVIAVHAPMPGDVSSFVAVRFNDGSERETTVDAITAGGGGGEGGGGGGGGGGGSSSSSSSSNGSGSNVGSNTVGNSGGGGGGSGGGSAAAAAAAVATVATDVERAQLLSLGIDDEQLAALNALPPAEQLEMAAAFGLTRIPSSLLAPSAPPTSSFQPTAPSLPSSSAPSTSTAAAAAAAASTGGMQRKTVPADNSCLFTSVGYLLQGHDMEIGQ